MKSERKEKVKKNFYNCFTLFISTGHQKRSRNVAHEHNEEELPPLNMTPPIKDSNKKKDIVVPMPAPNTLPSNKPPKKKMKVKKK